LALLVAILLGDYLDTVVAGTYQAFGFGVVLQERTAHDSVLVAQDSVAR
jgi:hypothetical protein